MNWHTHIRWLTKPGLTILGLILLPAAALAQETDDKATAQTESRATLEEVLVTARRTTESAQDVPVAVSAMSSSDLRRESINSPTDLNGKVPSLVIGTGSTMRNVETPTIRGQGAQFGTSPGVVVYMSEVALPADPVANYQGGPGKFFDLNNVQILKGSQGTLFGRNTTGGAMLLEPAKPHESFAVSVRGGVSRMASDSGVTPEGHNYELVMNVPLVEETLMVRLGGQVYQRDGFTQDVVTGKDYDNKDYWTARAGLLWRPTDNIENYLMANYSDSADNGTGNYIERINREGLNRAIPSALGVGALTRLIPGLDLSQSADVGCLLLNYYGPSSNCGQDILDEQAARGPRRVQLSADPEDKLESGLYLNKLNIDLTDDMSLVNIISYSTMDHTYRWDLDGSRAAFNEFVNDDDKSADVETYTAELQLQGVMFDALFNYVVGAYYEETEAFGAIIGRSLLFVDVEQRYEKSNESTAVFAQGTLDLGLFSDLLAGLNLTAGARYTQDKSDTTVSILQVVEGAFTLADNTFDASVDDSAVTYTLGLDYKFDNALLYGKVSRGYKTGGVSVVSVNPDNYTFDPEFVLNYEIGQKADFAIGETPVRLNTALYYTDYTDMQVSAPDAYLNPDSPSPVPQLGQANYNVGEAYVMGFEMDLTVQLFGRLTLIGTYGYTEAEYDSFSYVYRGATPQLDCTGNEVESGNRLELDCVPFKNTPEHQYSLTARYLLPLDPVFGDVDASVTYAWTDEQYSAYTSVPEGEPGAYLPSFGIWNANVGWNSIFGSSFGARLYGTNLSNERYRISNSNQWNLTYFQASIMSQPREIGLEVSYDFE